jgi:hypothetical protein
MVSDQSVGRRLETFGAGSDGTLAMLQSLRLTDSRGAFEIS